MWAFISANELWDYVHILGVREDVPLLLAASDLLVYTTLREGLPGVILESLSVGTPVLASNILPNLEISNKVSGLWVKDLNLSNEDWCNDVKSLMFIGSTPFMRQQISTSFKDSVFSIEKTINQFKAVWHEHS